MRYDLFYAKIAHYMIFMYIFLCLLVQIVLWNRPEIKNIWNSGDFFSDAKIGQIWVDHVARVLGEDRKKTHLHETSVSLC